MVQTTANALMGAAASTAARRRGRPVQGAELVDHLADSSHLARQRLKMILRTLEGQITVEQACAILGIKRSMFNKLRSQFLARATGLLEPRTPGRNRRVPTEVQAELTRLRQENAALQLELRARQVREEIAVVMPHLLRPRPRGTGPGSTGPGMRAGPATGRTARGKKTRQ